MKNSLDYLKLWRKKRSELPVTDDPKAGWFHMQSILDQQMPVIEKPVRFKGFKILPTMFIALSAAAMVYFSSKIYTLEKHKHNVQHMFHKSRHTITDSTTVDSVHELDKANDNEFSKLAIPEAENNENGTSGKDHLLSANRLPKGLAPAPGKAGLSTGRPIGSSLNTLVNGRTPAPVNKKNLSLFNSKNKSNSPLLNTKSDIVQGHSLLVNKTTGNSRSISFFSNKLSKIRGAGHQGKYNIFRPSGRQKPGFIMQHSPSQDTSNNRLNYNLAAITPWPNFDPYISNLVNPSLVRPYNLVQGSASAQSKTLKDKKGKLARINDPTVSHLDWVVSIGANTSGSFTSPKQNANFYGTAPVDVFFGISVARQFNDHWGINPHVNLFSPQIINTAYAHINQSKVDSGQSLQISSSRKIYSINIPVCITYKPPGKFSFKAGPVFNIPVKQINTTSTLQPNIIRTDSAYYRKITGILNRTQYAQTFNYGISGGVSFQFKRLIFDATYSKSLNGYKVTSDFGTYKSYNGTLQLTIGFQLNKPKP